MKVLKLFKSVFRRISKILLLDIEIPVLYRIAARKPLDNSKVVFVEVRYGAITNNFRLLYDELVNNYDYEVKTHYLRNVELKLLKYRKVVYKMIKDIATAKYVFINDGCNAIAAAPLRKGTELIQTWHACGAFKKFGRSTGELLFGESAREQRIHPNYKNQSLVAVSSPEVVWAYEEAMGIESGSGVVQPLGVSRTDVFYDDRFIQKAYDNLYEKIPQAKGKKVILYAPTFRGRVAEAATPDKLDVQAFADALGKDYVLLIKHHPLVKKRPEIPQEFSNFAYDITDDFTIENTLCVSDICITDYSSVIFEYSIFEKPVILFAYDLEDYFDWRGFYYDFNDLAPGLVAKTNGEMLDYILNLDERFDKQKIEDFRYKFMRSCDGNATKRILEYAFKDLEEHKAKRICEVQ